MGYYELNKNVNRAAWLVGIMLYLSVNYWAISIAISEPDIVRMPIDAQIETMAEKQGVSVERLANAGYGGSTASGALSREYLVSKAHRARTPIYYAYEKNDNGYLEKIYWTSSDNAVLVWKDLYKPSIRMGFIQYDGIRDGNACYDIDASGPLFIIAIAMLVASFFAGAITLVAGVIIEGIHDIRISGGKNKKQNEENGI